MTSLPRKSEYEDGHSPPSSHSAGRRRVKGRARDERPIGAPQGRQAASTGRVEGTHPFTQRHPSVRPTRSKISPPPISYLHRLSPSRTACARTSSSASDPAAPPSSPARGATVNPPPSSATASARSSRTYSPRRSRAPSDDETTRLTHQPTPTPPPLPRTTPRRNGRTGHSRSRPRPTTACGTTTSSSSHEPAQLCRHHRRPPRRPVTHHRLHPSTDPPRRGTKPPRV